MSKPLKVLAAPSNPGATGHIRIEHPYDELLKQGLIHPESKLLDVDTDDLGALGLPNLLKDFDIFWLQMKWAGNFLYALTDARELNPNLRIVLDSDDNFFAVKPWNPAYVNFSFEDLIWQSPDGPIKLNVPKERNYARMGLTRSFYRQSDALVVTGKYLAHVLSDYNKELFIMPNFLKESEWHLPYIPRMPGKNIRIGYQGGNTHVIDWAECHGALVYTQKQFPNVEYSIVTDHHFMTKYYSEYDEKRLILHPWADFSAHWSRSQILKPDIGICPLIMDDFNVCKSDLKFTEYAMMGVPVVASKVPPYSDTIIHGKTGFLASTPEEWALYLTMLIKDKDLRWRMGALAKQWALENRSLERNAGKIADMLQEVHELPDWFTPNYYQS